MYDMRYIRVNDVMLHVVLAGPEDGEPIFLLHGFPEFWYGWRQQIDYLAEKGYRVVVPDQRGYNLSDKPKHVKDYHITTLATDIDQLAEELGYEQINLVGHDWGAAVAWWMATIFPQRLKKLIILNVPYPTILSDQWKNGNWEQIFKSWYILFFQMPFVPEAVAGLMDYEGPANILRNTSRKGSFSEEDIARYKRAWAQPGALTGMVNWYRAMIRGSVGQGSGSSSREAHPGKRISVPTLILWGEKDVALTKDLAQLSADVCENAQIIYFPKATHWVQHDEAEAVNAQTESFVSTGQPATVEA